MVLRDRASASAVCGIERRSLSSTIVVSLRSTTDKRSRLPPHDYFDQKLDQKKSSHFFVIHADTHHYGH